MESGPGKAVQAEGTTSGNGLACSWNMKVHDAGEARGDSGATFSRAADGEEGEARLF